MARRLTSRGLFATACGIWLLLAEPQGRHALEGMMAAHMLMQLPLLAASGWLLAKAARPPALYVALDEGGWAGMVTFLLTLAFWMVPRDLDRALSEPAMEAVKFLSVPLLAGLPLAWSWPRLVAIGRGLIFWNLVSMLAVLGLLYVASPIRACVNYRLDQQVLVGKLLVGLALTLAFTAFLICLTGAFRPRR